MSECKIGEFGWDGCACGDWPAVVRWGSVGFCLVLLVEAKVSGGVKGSLACNDWGK